MRTVEEIQAEIQSAGASHDVETMQSLAAELESIGSPRAMGAAHSTLARAQVLAGDHAKAMEHSMQALEIFEELGDKNAVAVIYGTLGIVCFSVAEFPQGLEHLQRALDIHEESGNSAGVASVSSNIGSAFVFTGEYPQALEHFQKAQDIYEELNERTGVAAAVSNIGNVYSSTGDSSLALDYYNQALILKEELGDQAGMSRTISNIGTVYMKSGDHAKALEQFRKARELLLELGSAYDSGSIGNIVSALIALQEYEEASELLDEHDNMHTDGPSIRSVYHLNRAKLQEHEGDLDGAQVSLQEAMRIVAAAGLRPIEAKVRMELRDLAQKRNDFAAYIEHNNEYTRITEEINGKDTATKLAMQSKQREIDATRKETEKHMAVLYSTLPKHIADRVAKGEPVNDHHENATIIFMDIVGFTTMSSSMDSSELTGLLAEVFDCFDSICDKHNITKIKTIGDSYMAAGFENTLDAAHASLAMNASKFSWPDGSPLQYRIGMHLGPVTAGVIGTQRLQYDVWGDTVNVASRMESSGEPGKIHVSEAFTLSLTSADNVAGENILPGKMVKRGEIEIKGKGPMTTYWLEGA